MNLYCLLDKKSNVPEYYLASCDEDALRIASVMMLSSRPLYEFAEDFLIERVSVLPDYREFVMGSGDDVLIECSLLRRQLDVRRKEREDANA